MSTMIPDEEAFAQLSSVVSEVHLTYAPERMREIASSLGFAEELSEAEINSLVDQINAVPNNNPISTHDMLSIFSRTDLNGLISVSDDSDDSDSRNEF